MSRSAVRLLRGRGKRRLPAAPIRAAEWGAATVLALFSVLIATYPFHPHLRRGSLEITVLDIGQGDSIFAAFPDGRTMLIDGGGQAGAERIGGYRTGLDVGEDVVSPYLWSRGVKKLDVVALTHAHHDHLDGLHAVLANFKVAQLWVGHDENTRAYDEFLAEARAHGILIVHEQAGQHFDWDGVEGRFLWPIDSAPVKAASNNDSLVLRLTDRKIRFLLAGDIEKKVESDLLGEGQPLTADFLKVPHHGSKTSSTDAFIQAVQPKFAAISAGLDNPFGHPNAEVVDRYRDRGVHVLRTDMNGAITALTDGNSLRVSSFVDAANK
jgi:competence protein ComEC